MGDPGASREGLVDHPADQLVDVLTGLGGALTGGCARGVEHLGPEIGAVALAVLDVHALIGEVQASGLFERDQLGLRRSTGSLSSVDPM